MDKSKKERVKEMRDICLPEEKRATGPAANNLIYRKIGFLFTRLFVRTNITPNQITWIWGALLVFFSTLFIFNDPWIRVIGAIGWIVSFSLDCTDGQVARYKGTTSKRGLFLDLVIHCVTWPMLFFCIGLGEYLATGMVRHAIFGFMAGLSMMLIAAIQELYNSVGPDTDVRRGDNSSMEGKIFKSKKRYKLLRDISPLTFLNMYLVLLAATILDLLLPIAFPSVFPFELFWMTDFLAMFIFVYAIGFPIAFLVRFFSLYNKLT